MLEGPSQLCKVRSGELSILHSETVCKPRRLANMKKVEGEESAGKGAAVERPIRAIRRQRLAALVAEFGGPKALAEKTGTVDTHLIAIQQGRRDLGDKLAEKLEANAGKPFGWLDLPLGFSEEACRIAMQIDAIKDPQVKALAVQMCDTATLSFADKAAVQRVAQIREGGEAPAAPQPTPRPAPAPRTHTARARTD